MYFQVIHERVAKQIKTSCHILESEWDEERNEIINTSQTSDSRRKILTSIRNKIRWEKNRISNAIIDMENDGVHFTIEDIVRNYYHSASNRVSVFEYINKQIDRLYASGKERTSETYRQVLHSFMRFRKNDDLDFDMIDNNLIEQYEALLATENFHLHFAPEAIDKIADIAVAINENVENIGARRLHTVLEILLEDISFSASDKSGEEITITAQMVEDKLSKYTVQTDLSKFIL